ncbi:fimbrial protein, partial [Escherichia albertii]
HHNAKDSLWLKILSCYVPVFSPLQARWYPFKPVYIKGKSNDF